MSRQRKRRTRVPVDTWRAFAYLVSKCAEGAGKELIRDGKTPTEARNAIINAFIDMAAGEACRVARSEGRKPNKAKWRKATDDAFKLAVVRTRDDGPASVARAWGKEGR